MNNPLLQYTVHLKSLEEFMDVRSRFQRLVSYPLYWVFGTKATLIKDNERLLKHVHMLKAETRRQDRKIKAYKKRLTELHIWLENKGLDSGECPFLIDEDNPKENAHDEFYEVGELFEQSDEDFLAKNKYKSSSHE